MEKLPTQSVPPQDQSSHFSDSTYRIKSLHARKVYEMKSFEEKKELFLLF
jgi:hypothetical protein